MWTHEEMNRVLQGCPSEEVFSRVVNAFRFRQRNQRIKAAVFGIACLMAFVLAAIVYQAQQIEHLQHELQQVLRSTGR
jgi:hypothetical protein